MDAKSNVALTRCSCSVGGCGISVLKTILGLISTAWYQGIDFYTSTTTTSRLLVQVQKNKKIENNLKNRSFSHYVYIYNDVQTVAKHVRFRDSKGEGFSRY